MILGIRIKPVTGEERDVWGHTTYTYVPQCGRVYYCGGASYPSEIVVKTYETNAGSGQISDLLAEQGMIGGRSVDNDVG